MTCWGEDEGGLRKSPRAERPGLSPRVQYSGQMSDKTARVSLIKAQLHEETGWLSNQSSLL